VHRVLTRDPEAGGSVIASRRWRSDFERNSGRHRSIQVTNRPELDTRTEAALRRSLAVFQLGETGDGEHLLALAARTGDHDYLHAMRLFVAEEQEHARLLGLVLDQFDEPRLTRHWSDRVFQLTRRISGLRSEVLILLVAELVALEYYGLLAERFADDDQLGPLFGAIVADEVRHLSFHADTLPSQLEEWSRPLWWFARIVWRTVLFGSMLVVAWDHRRLFRRCGSSARRFFHSCRETVRRNEGRFFRTAPAGRLVVDPFSA